MNRFLTSSIAIILILGSSWNAAQQLWAAGASIGGFVPFVGISLTDEYKTLDDVNLGATFFISDPSYSIGGTQLGSGPYYDIALLDTGAATHILTQQASGVSGFNIAGAGLSGTETQDIGGATGLITMDINDAMGVYAAGLGDFDSAGNTLLLENGSDAFRGQTSFATLSAPSEWQLPNIVGLPMAAHHAIAILNDDPQIYQYSDRTIRTPQVELRDLGSGGGGITRRTDLKLRPGLSFVQGPLYVYNLNIDDILGGELNLHDNPASPSIVENAALFVDIDMTNGINSLQDKEFLFDTGADLTVISQLTAKRLGFDVLLDTPDFFLEVEGGAGVSSGVPGIFIDELNIDTVGGSFTLTNVPVAVLDVTNPNNPGNVIDGILGMHLFNGRNLVIDANPSIGQGGAGPSLYISDPVTQNHNWATNAASGPWSTAGNWSAVGSPDKLWVANVANVSGSDQTAVVSSNSTVFQVAVSGTPTADMTLQINTGATLTVFGETLIEAGGRVELNGGKLDTQFVNIEGGVLAGSGEVFAGTGPIRSPVRNLSGRVEPGAPVGLLTIDGDFSNQSAGTLAIDLGGTTAVTGYDQLAVDRFAFLDGILEVSLVDLGGGTFAPTMGDMFTILTADDGVSGTFDQMLLPGGFQWDVIYGANNVVLEVLGVGGLLGDYNGDSAVNAADYTAWRDAMTASSTSLLNDSTPGVVDESDFLYWRTHFGDTLGGGAGASSGAVPEPTSLAMLLAAAAMAFVCRRSLSVATRPVPCAASLRCASSWPN